MKRLRKLIGSKMLFRYVVEYVDLLPNGKVHCYIEDIKINDTGARKTTGHAFDYYDDRHKKWYVISDVDYYKILNSHVTKKTLLRKKSGSNSKSRTLDDLFSLTGHFIERLFERFINHEDAIPGVLSYVIENGYYIDDSDPIIQEQLEKTKDGHKRFYIYEHDFRMLWVCELDFKHKKLKLITTYDPTTKWFVEWIDSGKKLKSQVSMKEFIRSMK